MPAIFGDTVVVMMIFSLLSNYEHDPVAVEGGGTQRKKLDDAKGRAWVLRKIYVEFTVKMPGCRCCGFALFWNGIVEVVSAASFCNQSILQPGSSMKSGAPPLLEARGFLTHLYGKRKSLKLLYLVDMGRQRFRLHDLLKEQVKSK